MTKIDMNLLRAGVKAPAAVYSYKVEVIADSTGEWCGNGMRYETEAEAEAAARDLMSRWMAVREWRVVPTQERANVPWVAAS